MGLKRGRGTDSVDGNKLYRKTLGSPQLTPAKFRRQLKVVTLREGVQADYSFPTSLNGFSYVDLNQNDAQYEGATLTTIEETLLRGNDLISYKRTGDAQTELVHESLVEETDPPPPLSALVTTMTQEALGDGKSLLTYGVVPYVFPNQRWEINRPFGIPHEFDFFIPEQSYTFTEAGVAGPIPLPLPPGVSSESDEQIDVYRHRLKTGTQNLFGAGVLPITITGSRTTKDKQVEHIEKTLQLAGIDPAPPTALLDVTWQNLGNGAALEEHDFVDFLFTQETYDKEIADVIPHKFKALVPIQTSSAVSEGTAGPPVMLDGDLKRTSEQTNVFVVKNTRQFRDVTVLPVQLIDYKLTGKLQVSTVTNRIALGLQTITPDALTIDASVDNLGNNTSVRSVEAVDTLFPEESFGKTIPDIIPEKFRVVVPTRRHDILVADTSPNDRALATGELSYESAQVNAFVVKETSTFRDATSLPVSLPGYRMTQQQQVADVIATLATGLQTITPTPLTVESEVENLGNNLSLKTESTVPFVFPDDSYTKSILNLIPEKLRAAIPLTETIIESQIPPDVSTNPTLLPGEFERTEKRIAIWKKRISIKKLGAISVPVSVVDEGFTSENGGDLTTITHTLHNHGALAVETGLMFLKSEVIDLGNGYDVRTTEKGVDDNWPGLIGQDYDERLNTIIPYLTQVRAYGDHEGSPFLDIKPKDRWKQEERLVDLSTVASVLDNYLLSYPSKVNIDMPDLLLDVTGVIETAFGEGANSETGAFDVGASANFSVSMALKASAQSSASLIPDVTPNVVQFWGNNLDAMHYGFYLAQPADPSTWPALIAAKLTALVGSSVINWPKFAPKSVTITAKGMKGSVQATASSQGSAAQSTCGTSCPSTTSTSAGGTGFSHEKSLNLKTVRISPTIHGGLTILGPHTGTQHIEAHAHADATGLGPVGGEDHVEPDDVTAEIYNGAPGNYSIPASAGATGWPNAGLHLYKLDGQPYKYGYVQFHAIIVDASNFPTPT